MAKIYFPLLCLTYLLQSFFSTAHCESFANAYVVAVAMNQEKGATEDWNQFATETELLFSKQPNELIKKVHTRTVVGRNATLASIAAAVRWAFVSARKDDLVVVHISCHGGTEPKDGWCIETMDQQYVYGRDLKLAAARLSCPVLFLIDTCGSGGFAHAHARDIPLPENCACLCSSRSKQSTTNVLNICMNEGLWGAADSDDDQLVTLNELVAYVEARSKKFATRGTSLKESEMPVIVVGEKFVVDKPLTKVSEQLVAVLHDNAWHLARREEELVDSVRLHAFGYQDDPKKSYFYFNEEKKRKVFELKKGFAPVIVQLEGESKAAIVAKWDATGVLVKFPQSPKKLEVTVNRSDVKFPFPTFKAGKSD